MDPRRLNLMGVVVCGCWQQGLRLAVAAQRSIDGNEQVRSVNIHMIDNPLQ